MKILFLTSQIPSPESGSTIRPFHLIKNLYKIFNYDIYLISFVDLSKESDTNIVREYCREILLIPIEQDNNKSVLIQTLKNTLSLRSIASKIESKHGVFDPSFYTRGGVQKKIDNFIENHYFDCIYSDAGMAGYVADSHLPKIVEPLDANYINWLSYYRNENKFSVKLYWLIRFLQTFYRETRIYNKFDSCVLVTEEDKDALIKHVPSLSVIPNGVDIQYFKPADIKLDHPSLIFTGVMSDRKNIEAVLHFCSKIYPDVKKEYPNVKLYVVGKDPVSKIRELSLKDSSIIVTGFVHDMRPYLLQSSIFVCPHISGSGIKNKVLEAMSIGKPVITTPLGILGIKATSNIDVIIAKSDNEFSTKIIEVLSNYELRQNLGDNARKLIVSQYSWEHTTRMISDLLNDVCRIHYK